MPQPLDEKKRGALISVMLKKKLGDRDSYELKEKEMEDGAEVERSEHGLESAVDEIMTAFEAKNKYQLKSALRSFITMIMHEYKE
jgi:hypothetical protein